MVILPPEVHGCAGRAALSAYYSDYMPWEGAQNFSSGVSNLCKNITHMTAS